MSKSSGAKTRDEKLAEARRLLATYAQNDMVRVIGLTLDLIETEKEEKPTGPNYSAHEERAWNEAWEKKHRRESSVRDAPLAPAPDFAAMADDCHVAIVQNPGVPVNEIIEGYLLRAAKPAPSVVRDEAWWRKVAISWIERRRPIDRQEAIREEIEWFRSTFGYYQAPAPDIAAPACMGCGKPIDPNNYAVADGCPCNSRRGINHGLVARDVCTCDVCDPSQSGCSRVKRLETNMSLAPAFDVDKLLSGIGNRLASEFAEDELISIYTAIRVVAREMRLGKGGA